MPQTNIDEARMIDLIEAEKVDITVDFSGKIWINVNDKCLLRIGKAGNVLIDDHVRGRELVIGG